MKGARALIERAAAAVKIGLSGEEKELLEEEWILFEQWLEPLVAAETTGAEPLLYSHRAINVFREDEPRAVNAEELRRSVSHFAEGFYRVPSIID